MSGREGVRAWVWSISKPEKVCWQTRALTPRGISGCRSIPTRDTLSPVPLPPRALWAGWASEDGSPSMWESFSRPVRAGAPIRVLWPRRECGQNLLWLKSQGRWSLAGNCSSLLVQGRLPSGEQPAPLHFCYLGLPAGVPWSGL